MFRQFLQGLLRLLFIVYCIEAGLFLTVAPWRDVWGPLVGALPFPSFQDLLSSPFGRGAVTGYGLVHIVWGIHDANDVIQRRGVPRQTPRHQALERGLD